MRSFFLQFVNLADDSDHGWLCENQVVILGYRLEVTGKR